MADAPARLVAFVLALVGGLLAVLAGARAALRDPKDLVLGNDLDGVLLLLGGALALAGSLRAWKGPAREGGALAIAGGILALLAGHDVAGVLAIVGGVLFVVR